MRHRQRLAQGRIKHNRLYPDGLDAAAQEASNEAAIVRTTRLLWVIAGAMAAALVVADWVAGLSFDITKGWTMPTIIVALLALAWMSRLVWHRPALGFGAEITAQNLTIMMTATLLTYAAAATAIPYRDAEFHAFDSWIGFDWRAYLDFQHVYHLEAIRSGMMHVISLDNLQGLVSFPSFHTISAILFAGRSGRSPACDGGTIVLNGILITSAPIEGAHYLIDIIAGAIIAPIVIVAAVAIARRIGQASVRNLPLPPEPAFADPPSGATPAAEPTAS